MDIIDQMFSKWNNKWPVSMRFDQNVYWYKDCKIIKKTIWNEIINSPGKLQIRFDGFESGNGVLFLNDKMHVYENGCITKIENKINQALLLGFDVYNQEPLITKRKLAVLGIDLSKYYEIISDDGRINLIFGTNNNKDTKSPQFWIDKENLYLTRVITSGDKHTDIFFKNYQIINDFPVATKIEFVIDNELVMIEEYFNIEFPEFIDDNIFEPYNFQTLKWQ